MRALTVLVGCLAAVSAFVTAPTASATGTDAESSDQYVFPDAQADDGAHITAVKRLDTRMADLTVASPAMGGEVPVRVILPRGWSADSTRTFPTLYLLQGASDDYTSWTRETDVEELAQDADMLIVTPEGGRAGFYTNWWNYGRAGGPNWETFHTVELPQILERGYRAGNRRALAGLSEGGLGALNYAGRHPGEYVFAGSFSGVVDILDGALRSGINLTCMREKVDAMKLWGDPFRQRDLWDDHNPAAHVERLRGVKVYLSAAAGLPGPFDAGQDIFAGFLESPVYVPTRDFYQRLRAAGIDVTADLNPSGSHAWPYWQRQLHLAWPSVLSALQVTA
ncbi:hypothetical protein GCM10012280_33860 [Wenjunlia tyrosinilytica]|uniref:S-formylglutathione hydrolase FrmB n=1 Tax=Wenjunlia tyrosinilytica TaxID=1544741 RepID=A0A917ZRL4_9ACTN|nr:hypothetical protein GCM10012280_33860 [Wenjunlia tyrosinilytica]